MSIKEPLADEMKRKDWRFDPNVGGGLLLDLGSHCVDLLDFFLGPVALYIFWFKLHWVPGSGFYSIGQYGVATWFEHMILPWVVLAMLYVGIFPSFVGYVFWNRGVHEVGSNVAGIFVHLMPAFGALLAWIFLGEHIRLFHVVGIALILAGITLTTRTRRAVPEPGPE